MIACFSCTIKEKKNKYTRKRKTSSVFESEDGRAAFLTSARSGSLALACGKSEAKLYWKRGRSYSWIRGGLL